VSRVFLRIGRAALRLRRGFTLVELMVAVTGGLFISISVFLLARHASRFYQQEVRVASATLSGVIGYERLRADVARAGFMSTPNVRRDPEVCGNPIGDPLWPDWLRRLQSVFIEDVPPGQLPAAFAGNGISPQRITLSGSYTSAEQYVAQDVAIDGPAWVVTLSTTSGPALRTPGGNDGGLSDAALNSIFGAARALRIVDLSGRHHYATIQGVTGGITPQIVLEPNSPNLVARAGSGLGCGVNDGANEGALVNVVNIVRYDLKSLSAEPGYGPLYAAAGAAPFGEDSRVELIREELDVDGVPIEGTAELIAEYAVDLQFGATVAPTVNTALMRVPDANLADYAGNVEIIGAAATGPQEIRALHVQLSVRSREGDRDTDLPIGDVPLRFGMSTTGGAPFARVRTVQSVVALNNHLGKTWE
jgi:hypothetical protein